MYALYEINKNLKQMDILQLTFCILAIPGLIYYIWVGLIEIIG